MNQNKTNIEAFKIIEEMLDKHPALKVTQMDLLDLSNKLISIFDGGGRLFVAGNGGSAADAQHIVAEIMKSFERKQPLSVEDKALFSKLPYGKILAENLERGFPAIALGLNHSLTSAIWNDFREAYMEYAQELWILANEADAFLGISTSGNARNVLYAMVTAKAKGLFVAGLTGNDGGKMKEMADLVICVPASLTREIQEMHRIIYHALCRIIV